MGEGRSALTVWEWRTAVGETAILWHPRLAVVGVSIAMEHQQNDRLANG